MGNEAQVNHETGCSKKKKSIKWKILLPLSTKSFIGSWKPQNYLNLNHIWWIKSWRWLCWFNLFKCGICHCRAFDVRNFCICSSSQQANHAGDLDFDFLSHSFSTHPHTRLRRSCWSCKGRVWAVKKWMRKQIKKNKKILAAFHYFFGSCRLRWFYELQWQQENLTAVWEG